MGKIKFGTDGWRAIIARDYTTANVARVAKATAEWIRQSDGPQKVVIGYDCRFGGALFMETAINVFCAEGITVFYAEGFVTTPMISLACRELECYAGVVITASHNPPDYNGYKLKSYYGGPTVPAEIAKVEALVPETWEVEMKALSSWEESGMLHKVDLEEMYFNHVKDYFDLDAINQSGITIAYDAMYGAGQSVLPRILPNAALLHCEHNPSFYGQAPEPIHKNLKELSSTIAQSDSIQLGLANDGDADRIGMYDSSGRFIDAHHIILLLIHILHKYKNLTGKVVIAFSVSARVKKLCEAYGLECQVTKIGFKYICEIMVNEDVLVGGEESGGIAVKGHIPERDGIWDGLVILEHMAKAGKTIEELIQEVYEVTGAFAYNRNDLHITEELKQSIMENCANGKYERFDDIPVSNIETIDGYKYYLNDGETLMIRPSGTEPVLRVYAEAESDERVEEILAKARKTLLN